MTSTIDKIAEACKQVNKTLGAIIQKQVLKRLIPEQQHILLKHAFLEQDISSVLNC